MIEHILNSKIPIKHIVESGLSRLNDWMEQHDSGIITAWRNADEQGNKYTASQKGSRNRELKSALYMSGYGITGVKGSFIENLGLPSEVEVSEDSYFVVDLKDTGNLKRDLIKLGKYFDQDSILFIPRGGMDVLLIGTSTRQGSDPSYKVEYNVGDKKMGTKVGSYFTKVDGRPFQFRENIETFPVLFGSFSNAVVMSTMGRKLLKEAGIRERVTPEMARKANADRGRIISLNRSRRMRGLPLNPVPDKIVADKVPIAYNVANEYEGRLEDPDDCPEGCHVVWEEPIY